MRVLRRLFLVASCIVVTFLTACSDINESRARVQIRAPEPITTFTKNTTTSTTVDMVAVKTLWYALARQADIERWTAAAVKNAEAAARESASHPYRTLPKAGSQTGVQAQPAASAPTFGDLSSVVQCIKDHESGDYTESSHPAVGSGAFQYIPSTWQHWSARAGHGGYTYAYQAPPAVQDAVLLFTLTNGGAGNWSNRFGSDPCTAGLPGGG